MSYSRVINLVKKYLEMFTVIAEKKDDYKKFYKQYGKCLKLGIHDDSIDPRQRRCRLLVTMIRSIFEELKSEFEPLTKLMKEILILNDKVEKVNVSDRLVDSPCVITTAEYGWSTNMESISMTSYIVSKKMMEVNPADSIMTELIKKASAANLTRRLKDSI